jgi:hypothetical protein
MMAREPETERDSERLGETRRDSERLGVRVGETRRDSERLGEREMLSPPAKRNLKLEADARPVKGFAIRN